jgi:hypothetical protein
VFGCSVASHAAGFPVSGWSACFARGRSSPCHAPDRDLATALTIPDDQDCIDRMAAADRLTPVLDVDDPAAFEDIDRGRILGPRLAAAIGPYPRWV